ncbi:MAG TPA: carboxymuconolactone decarboxylase family protein [Streptosporangiaceae bacterium]
MPTMNEEIERSADVLFQELSAEETAAPWEDLAEFAPGLGEQVRYGLGAVYARPGLDICTRELVTMCMLAALGGCEQQMAFHMGGALRVGASAEAVVEALTLVSLSAGLPRGLNAMKVAREVFAKMGVTAPAPA